LERNRKIILKVKKSSIKHEKRSNQKKIWDFHVDREWTMTVIS
jgi:hypothetical protein